MAKSKTSSIVSDSDFAVNTTFGDWVIVGPKEYRVRNKKTGKRGSFWLCRCIECGNERWIDRNSLNAGTSRNCGCARAERLANYRYTLPAGEATFNVIYKHYQYTANKKNRLWGLTIEQFRELTQANCYYCGIPPLSYMRAGNTVTPYKYNGVDRRDNSLGYTVENSVSCCKICNMAKGSMTEDDFLMWVKRITTHRNL